MGFTSVVEALAEESGASLTECRGGQALSRTYGHAFCECMKWRYAPTGLSELVVYFLRRIHDLLRDGGFTAIITINSIIDGDVRKDGLEQIVSTGAQINMAVRGTKWPGTANLVVSLLAIHKGKWLGSRMLDNRSVKMINTFFEDAPNLGEPNLPAMVARSKNRSAPVGPHDASSPLWTIGRPSRSHATPLASMRYGITRLSVAPSTSSFLVWILDGNYLTSMPRSAAATMSSFENRTARSRCASIR